MGGQCSSFPLPSPPVLFEMILARYRLLTAARCSALSFISHHPRDTCRVSLAEEGGKSYGPLKTMQDLRGRHQNQWAIRKHHSKHNILHIVIILFQAPLSPTPCAEISDDELVSISVRDLNRQLKMRGLSRDQIIKQAKFSLFFNPFPDIRTLFRVMYEISIVCVISFLIYLFFLFLLLDNLGIPNTGSIVIQHRLYHY